MVAVKQNQLEVEKEYEAGFLRRRNPRNWLAEQCNNYTPFVVTLLDYTFVYFPFAWHSAIPLLLFLLRVRDSARSSKVKTLANNLIYAEFPKSHFSTFSV